METDQISSSTKSLQEAKSFSVTAQLTKPSQSICVYMSSVSWNHARTRYSSQQMQDAIAGVTISSQYKPQIDMNEFPVVDTRPMTDMVNEGFCRDWNSQD